MMKRNKWIMILIVLLLGIALYDKPGQGFLSSWNKSGDQNTTAADTVLSNAAEEGALKPGALAPQIILSSIEGQDYKIGGESDKPRLINFWASWCDPCKEEAADLKRFNDKYKDKLDIYGVNVTYYDKLDKVKKFIEEYDIPYTVLLDEDEIAYKQYNGIAFPTNVLVDKHGVIQDVIIGLLSPEALEKKIISLLEL